MLWRGSCLVVTVVLFFGSRICCSLTNDGLRKTDIASDAGSVENSGSPQLLQYQADGKENNEETHGLVIKQHVRRSIGDELNSLKDKAKKANSVYKWIKENWTKLFVIIVAIVALIVVVGIYRRCFSDSGSSGDDHEPNIVVVKMLKPDNKGNGELDPILTEGITQRTDESGRKGTGPGQATHKTGNGGNSNTRIVTEEKETGGKLQKQATLALVAGSVQRHEVKRHGMSPTVPDLNLGTETSTTYFQEAGFLDLHTNSIPISGYTTFQQIDFCKVYFEADQLRDMPTRICQGSTSKGPFPYYEEIPLIKIFIASLMKKSCSDYIPIASTHTNLHLTVSP